MRNRLRGARGYLCGPMDRAIDGGVEWRVTLKEMTSGLEVCWLDPCDKPIDGFDESGLRARLLKLKREGDYASVAQLVKPIRCVDLRMVDLCDFMVAKIDVDTDAVYSKMLEAMMAGQLKEAKALCLDLVSGCGTYEEISWANRCKKPVIPWCPAGKVSIPNWMFAMLPHQMMFGDLDGVVSYLWHVAKDDVVEHHKRWYFFRYDKMKGNS